MEVLILTAANSFNPQPVEGPDGKTYPSFHLDWGALTSHANGQLKHPLRLVLIQLWPKSESNSRFNSQHTSLGGKARTREGGRFVWF